MSLRRLATLAVGTLGALTTCSFLLTYDGNQACSDGGSCLSGYHCDNKVCVKGGPDDGCPTPCGEHERCLPVRKRCVHDTCTTRRCAPGEGCTDTDAGTVCVVLAAPELGHACTDDADCADGATGGMRVCYRSSSEGTGLGERPGVCVEPCTDGLAPCSTPGALCHAQSLANVPGVIKLCLTPHLLWPCDADSDCADDGLLCSAFDHPTLGTAAFCDRPVTTGATAGQLCGVSATNPCANGLCTPLPASPGQQATCVALCDSTSCPTGQQCGLAEVVLGAGKARLVPACLTAATRCVDCAQGAGLCGPDAPHCTSIDDAMRCLAQCSPDGGGAACASGTACTAVDAGYRCLPSSGSCG